MSTDDAETPEAPSGVEARADRRPLLVAVLHGLVVLACIVGVVWHQFQFWGWYIEDAAISFAFARNWAWGEGLVAYPGGERLEGYSNFTWVALLTVAELLGFDSFDASKVLQAVLGGITVPLVYWLAREASPNEAGQRHAPLVAASYLAAASTYAIWASCGLENALFNCILAAALLRSAIEIRTGGFPFAAFFWFLLAISRPEAILYCAIAGFLTMCFALHAHGTKVGVRRTLQWLALFFVPFGVYHAVRFSYFAYEFPQTYYGKMTTKDPKMAWNTRGWRYVRNWSHDLWTAYFLPLWIFGLVGTRGWRGIVALFALLFMAFWLIYPTNDAFNTIPWWPQGMPAPTWWVDGRSWMMVGAALLLPNLALGGRKGWQARVLCWGIAVGVLFFSIYTLGDWMKAWRWMSLLQVPAAVLFAMGAGALADAVDRVFVRARSFAGDKVFWAVMQVVLIVIWTVAGPEFVLGKWWLLAIIEGAMITALMGGLLSERSRGPWTMAGWTVLSLIAATALIPNITHTMAVLPFPETGPFAIKKRVQFVLDLKDTLEIEGPMVDLDVDQGAHLWWGRGELAMMDIAGLVDIPMAQHRFQKPFIREYLFEERRPHFAHVHGGWASNSRIPTHPEWRRDYVEIPGYPAGRTKLHIGNHVRRDLFLSRRYEPRSDQPDRRIPMQGGLVLEGFDLPSEPAQARLMWVEIAIRNALARKEGEDVAVHMFASQNGELVQTWAIPLNYGWLPADEWKPNEVNVGRYKLPIPKDMAVGDYDIGFAFFDPDGAVLPPRPVPTPDDPEVQPDPDEPEPTLPDGAWIGTTDEDEVRPTREPIYVEGEVVFPGALTVVSLDELSTLAKTDRQEALEHGRKGRCEKAEHSWFLSKRHRPIDKRYRNQHGPTVAMQLSICWSWRAKQEPPDSELAVTYLERARLHDHRQPAYLEAKDPVADAHYALGMAAREAGNWEEAFEHFSRVLRADPWRSWARRYAEEARALRLGIDPESLAEKEAKRAAEREERMQRAREAREKRDRAAKERKRKAKKPTPRK